MHRWLDQELDSAQRFEIESHVKDCGSCAKEAESIRQLHVLLRDERVVVQPSAHFEETFWAKVSESRKQPWIHQVFQNLEDALSFTSFSRVFAAALIGLALGGSGGAVATYSALSSASVNGNRISSQYLSGFREISGLPAPSLAASYLRAIDPNSTNPA